MLHVAFELDDLRWTLTMATGMGKRPRQRQVRPRDREAVLCEIEETKRRFGLGSAVRVVSCYEAGREGFWLHRWLTSEGIENRVVDSASIEVNRRKRRVKADRLDGRKLLRLLIRHESGERGVWSVVRVPSVEAEDARQVHREMTALKRDRRELLRNSTAADVEQVRQLMLLDGIGENSAWVFVTEFFGWRQFRNRREVGGLAGLTPTGHQSGATNHEQGISKAGNRHVRHMAIQVAWGWLRYQPDSELTRWWERKYGWGSSGLKKTGIVALARRLLIELWRYLETGAIPEGATLKA